MTATVAPRCSCGHVGWKHLADHGYCRARSCGCTRYFPPAPWPSADERAVLSRIENTRPAPESYRPEEDQ